MKSKNCNNSNSLLSYYVHHLHLSEEKMQHETSKEKLGVKIFNFSPEWLLTHPAFLAKNKNNENSSRDWNELLRQEQVCQKENNTNSPSSESVKRNFNFSMKWLFCFMLRCPVQGWAPWVLFILLFLCCRVFSLSWDLMTRNRMHLIISVKAVFILIWPLLMPSTSPFLSRAWKHSNYLIAWVLFVICRVWTLLKPEQNLQAENKDFALKSFPPGVCIILPSSYKTRKIKNAQPVFLIHKMWTLQKKLLSYIWCLYNVQKHLHVFLM